MKNKKSRYFIVAIALFIGLLHLIIGPNYQGILKDFVRGYLIDLLLPMNIYLLLQISLRKHLLAAKSRIIASLFTFGFGTIVEILQSYGIAFFGSTFDLWDITMYGIGVGLGIAIDFTILDNLENQSQKKE